MEQAKKNEAQSILDFISEHSELNPKAVSRRENSEKQRNQSVA